MLQQTQVSSVMRYYDAFMQRFPTVESLAAADQDAVLAQWTGLGYYSRARNLHKAAREVTTRFEGEFPSDLLQLQTLPGVGRSTAGAIASLAFGEQAAILDGNVKRVLARVHAVEGPPAKASTINALWSLAEQHTPDSRFGHYTQAMMDLGATLCTRSNPQCLICPLNSRCVASHQGNPTAYPQKAAKKTIPSLKTSRRCSIGWLNNTSGFAPICAHKRAFATPSATTIWTSLRCSPRSTQPAR